MNEHRQTVAQTGRQIDSRIDKQTDKYSQTQSSLQRKYDKKTYELTDVRMYWRTYIKYITLHHTTLRYIIYHYITHYTRSAAAKRHIHQQSQTKDHIHQHDHPITVWQFVSIALVQMFKFFNSALFSEICRERVIWLLYSLHTDKHRQKLTLEARSRSLWPTFRRPLQTLPSPTMSIVPEVANDLFVKKLSLGQLHANNLLKIKSTPLYTFRHRFCKTYTWTNIDREIDRLTDRQTNRCTDRHSRIYKAKMTERQATEPVWFLPPGFAGHTHERTQTDSHTDRQTSR